MGSWISLNQFKFFDNQILGFLGIGSAPEFLENLMWKKFNNKMKKEIKKKGIYNLKHGNYEYPITYQLIKDGRKNKILNKKIINKIYVTMIHGKKDEVVPVNYSKRVLKIFKNAKKKLLIIKNGDHSLSSKKNLKKITTELNNIISNSI
jgi:esterase/lipase